MADISQVKVGSTTYDVKDGDAVINITRSGTTFTATKHDGTTFTFTQQDNNTLNTAGSTDTSSKIFLIGATSQAANPQTYSDNEVYTTSGTLRSTKLNVADHVTQQYNATTQALDFIFS